MMEICQQGMSKEDCNEGVGETGGAAWRLEVLGLELLLEHFLVLRTSDKLSHCVRASGRGW